MPASFIPDANAEADSVEASSARFRQIADYQQGQKTAMRAARIAEHYRKYPWTNPGLAVAFAKWKEAYGPQAAKGLARAAWKGAESGDRTVANTLFDPKGSAAQDAIEAYAMTNEFKRQAKQRQQEGGGGGGFFDQLADVVTKPVTAPWRAAQAISRGDISGVAGAAFDVTPLGQFKETSEAIATGEKNIIEKLPYGKAAVRAGFTALESPYQAVQGHAMEALTGLIGPIGNQAKPAPAGSEASRMGAVSGAPDTQPLSSGGIALQHIFEGKPVDLGEGFLPGGGIEKEHTQRLREIASLDYGGKEHFLTPGRTLAYAANNAFGIAEPGSKPYNFISGAVDAVAIIKADPANIGLTAVGEVGRLRKGFDLAAETEKAGGIASAWRTFTHGPTVQKWGDSPDGAHFFQWVAGLNPRDDFLKFQRATGWKIGGKDSIALMGEDTPEGVRAVFDPLAGVAVREQPSPWSFGSQIRQSAGTRRIFNTRSTDVIDRTQLDGPSGGLNQAYNWYKNAKIPEEQISPVLHDLAQSRSGFGAYESIKNGMTAGQLAMEARGVPRYEAQRVTKLFENDLADGSIYNVKQITDGSPVPGIVIDGTPLPQSSPHLWAEAMNDKIYLPKSVDIDKTLARYGRVLGIKGTGAAEDPANLLRRSKYAAWSSDAFLTHLQSTVWVPLALLRGAWTVRVIGEEQIRMAASGLSNVFSHPIRHIGWSGERRDASLTAEGLSQAMDTRGARTPEAEGFFADLGSRKVARKGKQVFVPEDGHAHSVGWADELIKLHSDPVANNVARTVHDQGDLNALKDKFWDDVAAKAKGSEGFDKFRLDMMENERLGPILETRSGSDAYIDSVYERVHTMTAGDDDLTRFVATGQYGDVAAGDIPLTGRMVTDPALDPTHQGLVTQHKPGDTTAQVYFDGADQPISVPVADLQFMDDSPIVARTMAHDGVKVDKKFVNYLTEKPEKPLRVVGDEIEREPGHANILDRAVRSAFSALMAKPSNYLSRSPMFKQKYWERIAELMPVADARTQALARGVAADAKLPKALQRSLVSNKVGELSYQEVDDLAKGHALDSVRDLLYDLNRRSQFFDATRLLFPFGEAWKEILGRWAKIPLEHPEVVRKFQIGITELRESNPFEVLPGAVAEPFKNQGFFFKDENGKEAFAYPWSHQITDALIGVPVPFTGQAAGLSLALNVMPGVGPVVQFAANGFMDRFMSDPKYDAVRDFIFPYGEPDRGHGIVESFFPAWMQKMTTAAGITTEDTRMLNNTAMQVMAYGQSVGMYDLNSAEGIRYATKDSLAKAKELYVIRGTFQFGAPAAPTPKFLTESKKGLVLNSTLRDDMYRMSQNHPDTAVAKFLDRFGEQAFYATQSLTMSGAYALPFTKEQVAWQRKNPQLTDKYPTTYGFFAPPGKPEDFDYDSYLRSIVRGEREPLKPEEWAKHANETLGYLWYDRVREKLGLKAGESGNRKQQLFLTGVRDRIREAYPGWQDVESTPNKVAHAMDELEAASNDRGLQKSNSELTTALGFYFQGRAKAIAAVKVAGGSSEFGRPGYASGQKYSKIRTFLRTLGEALVEQYPQFSNVWETVLHREVGEE